MPAYRYDGSQFVEMDGRSGNGSYRRRWNGYEWVRMAGYRYDGVDWVELWPPPGSVAGVTLTPLWLNIDEAPITNQPITFNIAKDPQI